MPTQEHKEDAIGGDYHQIESDISLPTTPELLLKVITREQAVDIANKLGRDRLQYLAAVNHNEKIIDFDERFEREADDLNELRKAITEVTGKSKPWIVGYASDLAECLLTFIESPESSEK